MLSSLQIRKTFLSFVSVTTAYSVVSFCSVWCYIVEVLFETISLTMKYKEKCLNQ